MAPRTKAAPAAVQNEDEPKFKLVGELPGGTGRVRGPRKDPLVIEFVEFLRENTNEFCVYPYDEDLTVNTKRGLSSRINNQSDKTPYAFQGDDTFESRVRDGVLYVRHVSGEQEEQIAS